MRENRGKSVHTHTFESDSVRQLSNHKVPDSQSAASPASTVTATCARQDESFMRHLGRRHKNKSDYQPKHTRGTILKCTDLDDVPPIRVLHWKQRDLHVSEHVNELLVGADKLEEFRFYDYVLIVPGGLTAHSERLEGAYAPEETQSRLCADELASVLAVNLRRSSSRSTQHR